MTSGHFDDNGNWVEDNTVSGNTTTSTTPLTGDPSEVKPNKAQQKAINKINAFADDTVFTGKTDVPKDTNLEDFNFPVYENQDAEGIRAKNQSGWDQAGNFLTQSILGEVLGGAIQGAGSIAEIPRAIINEFGEDNYDFNNFIIQLGKNIKESTQDKFPIYREKPNESFDISDPAWWWSNGVSVASTLSLLIPAMGEAKLAGAAAKGLGTLMETYKVFDSLNKVGKAGENINLLGRVGKALEAGLDTRNYWTNLAHSAVTMRNAENFMEAGQVFTDSKNKALGKWQSEQDFQTWLNTPEGREYSSKTDNVNQDDASNYIASHAAYRDYNLNAVNLVFDTLQLMPLLKGFKNSAVEPLFGKAFATQTEAVLGREATRAEKFLNTGKKVGLLLGEQVSEGVEEGVNALSQMEGNYFGNYLLTGESKDKKARLKEYLADSSTWEQAFWGALGGVAFSGGTRLVNNIREKTNQVEDPYADEVRASEISNRATKINNLASTIKAVQNGDDPETGKKFSGTPQEIEEQKNNKINQLKKEGDYDLALNAIKHGNYNSLIEHINSPSFTDILVNSGLTNKDDIQKAKNHMLSNFREVKESYDAAYNNIFPTKLNPATKQILINNNVRLGGLAKSLYEDNINTEKKIAKLRTQDPYFQTDEYKNNAGEVDAALEVISNNLAIQHIEESIKESNDFVADQARKKIEELKENVKNSQSILDENQKNRDEKKQPALSYNFKNDLAYALARKKINDTYLSTVNAQIYENTKNTEKKGKEIETEINKATRDFETKQREKYNNFINTKTGVSDLTTTLQVLERGEALDEGISGVPLTKNNTKYFSKFVKDKIAKIENEAKVKERKITNRTTVDTSSVEGFTKTSKAYTSLEKKLAAGEFEDAQAQVDSMIKSYTKQENDVWDAKRTKESAEILEFLKKKKVEVDNNLVVASAAPIPTKNESTSNVNEIKGLLDSEEAKEVSALISEKPAIDFTKQANKDARERELQAKTIRVGAKLIKLITDSLGTKEGDNLEFGEIVKFLGDSLGVNYLATNINLLSFAYNYGLNTGMFTGEKVPTKVSVGQALKDYLAKPIETDVPTDNENSNKEVTNIYTDLLFDLEDTDGIITLNKNQEGVIGTLLKDLRVGDLLEVSIDTDNKSKGYSYDETKDDKDRVPLKISYRDTRIAYMNVLPQTHGGIKYLGGDTDVTNLLMDDNILDRLEENFTDFVNLVKGRNIDNPKLDDLLTELINVNEGKIKLKENNIYTNEGLKAIKHLGNIILYGVNLKEKFPSFERDALKSKINSWNFKIKRDIYGSKQFRDLIGTDTKKVITVKVASKSPGSVIFSEDSENKKVLRPLNEVIDSINLVHSRYNTANSIDLDYLYGTGRVHTSSNVDTKGYNGLYVLVPTAQISETGEVTNIPIPITFNSVFGKQHEDEYPEQREYNEKIEDHITKIIRDITSKYSEGERVFDAQLEELGKYVVTSTKANNNYVRIYPDDFRLKIEFTSADVNDQKKVNILIKDDNGTFLNNATLTDKNLRQAVRGMTRSVNLVVKNGKWQYKYDIFTDFDGVEYEYLHWLVKSGAILTDIGAIKDSQGNIISNVSGRGDTPLIINIENPASSNVIKEKAKFNKEITTVTKFAEENKLDKAYQELYDLADKLGIAVKDNTDQPISDRFAGYSPDKVIRVYKNWQNEEVAVKSRLLAHESIHGIFHISEKSDEIYNRLEDFFNSIKDLESADFTVKAILTEIGSAIGRDRKSGLEEIVTYGLTNKNFATFLNNHLSDKNNEKSESLWTSLKNIILEVIEAAGKVLGINTKLDELNSILNDFVKINTEKIEKKENEFGNDLDSDIDTNDIKMAKIGDRISMTPEVAYTFKVTDRIITNLTKINQWEKQIKDSDVLWNKLQKDLGIPKDQIELIKNSEGNNIEEKLSSFLANYSYTIEINTATGQKINDRFTPQEVFFYNGDRYEYEPENDVTGELRKEQWLKNEQPTTKNEYENALKKYQETNNKPTSYYSNLTVAGGTAYTENEIATPSITPSIKGHAQFATENGIGWFRSDDEQGTEKYTKDENDPFTNIITGAKTRRILEVQSDLYQKGRNLGDIEQIIKDLQKSGDLKIDCN